MTIEQGAVEATVRIGPVPLRRSWKWRLVVVLVGLLLVADSFAGHKLWGALLWLVITCANVVLPFVMTSRVRSLGVYLTPEAAVLHGRHRRRRRRVPWLQVQSVVSHLNSNGASDVQLILENGEAVALPFPRTLWRKGDALYEQDFQRIDQWWLAHRGESWRPVRPEAPPPATHG
jgi:hypothetical protein